MIVLDNRHRAAYALTIKHYSTNGRVETASVERLGILAALSYAKRFSSAPFRILDGSGRLVAVRSPWSKAIIYEKTTPLDPRFDFIRPPCHHSHAKPYSFPLPGQSGQTTRLPHRSI